MLLINIFLFVDLFHVFLEIIQLSEGFFTCVTLVPYPFVNGFDVLVEAHFVRKSFAYEKDSNIRVNIALEIC